jgi:hypothetical protein
VYCIQVIVLFLSILLYIYKVRLPKLNRRKGWPIAMFRTLLIAHARSCLREEQLVMSHLFQFGGGGYLKCYWENWLQVFRTFLIIFGLRIYINLLAPEFYVLILARSVSKIWIIQEPKKVALWNKRHFEEKTESVQHV